MSLHEEGSQVDPHYYKDMILNIEEYLSTWLMMYCFQDLTLKMENYLDKCKAAGVTFKTMRKSVKDIKHFIRRAKAEGLEPSEDMLTYNILENLKVVPQDDDLLYKEVDLDVLPMIK